MYLGIEIGGTKLQLGVGDGRSGVLAELLRLDIEPAGGAEGIRRQILEGAGALAARHDLVGLGIGFGGPVDSLRGRTIKSHQIEGWDDFPLADWCRQRLGIPVTLGNDCDVAALAEARWGAGRGRRIVFYVTVGTGVGGGLVIDGQSLGAGRPAVAEIGHLRPGPQAVDSEQTVESMASGWGIVAEALALAQGDVARPLLGLERGPALGRERRLLASHEMVAEAAHDLRTRAGGDWERLTAKQVAEAAADGNVLAQQALDTALETLGWAIAQVITITSAECVVVGGGVSLLGETRFFAPLRAQVARYVFPPLLGAYRIEPARLGEEVVVHGAVALAAGV